MAARFVSPLVLGPSREQIAVDSTRVARRLSWKPTAQTVASTAEAGGVLCRRNNLLSSREMSKMPRGPKALEAIFGPLSWLEGESASR
jgi:hypothetical protein